MEEHTPLFTPELEPRYKITVEGGCLRAELRNHGTMEDMEAFLMTVAATCKVLDHGRVLISVDSDSRISSLLQQPMFSTYLNSLWSGPWHRVAVLGERADPQNASAHVDSFAQQRGIDVRSFDDEAAALQWMRDRRAGFDRRCKPQFDYPGDRRRSERRGERAAAGAG